MGVPLRNVNAAPVLGDTVHYVMADESLYPAVVIRVHNFGCCDLQVMTHAGLLLKQNVYMRLTRDIESWHWPHQI